MKCPFCDDELVPINGSRPGYVQHEYQKECPMVDEQMGIPQWVHLQIIVDKIAALRAEAERLKADARLGRMVRAMPEFAYLRRDEQRWCVSYHDKPNAYADTPEEALVAAGCGEVEE